MKQCNSCFEWKPLDEYTTCRSNKDGLDRRCKECKADDNRFHRGSWCGVNLNRVAKDVEDMLKQYDSRQVVPA